MILSCCFLAAFTGVANLFNLLGHSWPEEITHNLIFGSLPPMMSTQGRGMSNFDNLLSSIVGTTI